MSRYTVKYEPDTAWVEQVVLELRHGDRFQDPGVRLATIHDLYEALDTTEVLGVAEMRQAGASWAELGAVLGTSREAAWQRYHTLVAASDPLDEIDGTSKTGSA